MKSGGAKKVGAGEQGLRSGGTGLASLYVPPIDSGAFVTPSGDSLWYPWAIRPKWLDGSLPGDRGFDPFGFSKQPEFLQFDLDQLDQNKGRNVTGEVIGKFRQKNKPIGGGSALAPYSDVFGNLQRFRECELVHGRWCMIAIVGMIWSELVTGVGWNQAGASQLDGAYYSNFDIKLPLPALVAIQVLLVGGAEILRNNELEIQKRTYPGGYFDPFGFSQGSPQSLFALKTAEIKHSRLAMIAVAGAGVKALFYGKGLFA